jgi:hypothetical protein
MQNDIQYNRMGGGVGLERMSNTTEPAIFGGLIWRVADVWPSG